MEFKIVEAKTAKVIHNFHDYFSKTMARDFPHYSKKTVNYFINKAFSEKYFLTYVGKKDKKIYLALIDKEIAGYLVSQAPYGGVAFCSWVAVDSKFRGMGIASALLDAWEKESFKIGAHKLELWTDERNIEFYKKRHFKLAGKIFDNYFGSDDYLFYKTLRKSSNL